MNHWICKGKGKVILHSSWVQSSHIPTSSSSIKVVPLLTNWQIPKPHLWKPPPFNSFFPPTLKNTISIWAAKSHGMVGYWSWIRPQFKLYLKEKIKLGFEELVKFSRSFKSIIWIVHFVILLYVKRKTRKKKKLDS